MEQPPQERRAGTFYINLGKEADRQHKQLIEHKWGGNVKGDDHGSGRVAEYLARRPLKIILQDDKLFENPYSTFRTDSPNINGNKITPRERYLLA